MVAHKRPDGAIDDMRERYNAVAVEIADALSVLAKAAAGAPAGARAAALTAIAKIASAQKRLSHETHRLPASYGERFAVMHSVLQAQQGAFVQLALIVKQLEAPRGRRVMGGPDHARLNSELARAVLVSRRIHVDGLGNLPNHRRPNKVRWPAPRARVRRGRRTARSNRASRLRVPVLIKAVASRSLILVAVVASGLLVAYGTFPRASDQPQPTTKSIDLPTRTLPAEPLPAPRIKTASNREPPTPPQNASPDDNTKEAVVDPRSAGVRSELRLRPEASPHAAAPSPTIGDAPALRPSASPQDPAASVGRNDPLRAAVAKQEQALGRVDTAAATPPPNAFDRGFVAVLFTHKEQATVKRAFSSLQQHFPALLRHRQSELQAVDMGEKGVWHRLVLLPPGSREQAGTVCQTLMAGGYDRCWVKAY